MSIEEAYRIGRFAAAEKPGRTPDAGWSSDQVAAFRTGLADGAERRVVETLFSRHGIVTVEQGPVDLPITRYRSRQRQVAFVLTGRRADGTGRASVITIPECYCDRVPCRPRGKGGYRCSACDGQGCHGSGECHELHALVLAATVLKTYTPTRPAPPPLRAIRARPMPVAEVAAALGLTIAEYRAELTKAAA